MTIMAVICHKNHDCLWCGGRFRSSEGSGWIFFYIQTFGVCIVLFAWAIIIMIMTYMFMRILWPRHSHNDEPMV